LNKPVFEEGRRDVRRYALCVGREGAAGDVLFAEPEKRPEKRVRLRMLISSSWREVRSLKEVRS